MYRPNTEDHRVIPLLKKCNLSQVHLYLYSTFNVFFFFFSSRRRHTRWTGDWSSDVCSSDLTVAKRYKEDARSFAPKGESRLEVLQTRARGDLAFWTGYQHARVHMAAKPGEARSEERRVGKECRSRGSPDQ